MIKRSLIFSTPGRLKLCLGQLVWEGKNGRETTVPIEDIGFVLIESVQTVLTVPLLTALSEANAVVIFCGGNHMPCSFLLPMEGHTLMQKTFRAQIGVSDLHKDILWGQVIRAKIENQGKVALLSDRELGRGLCRLSKDVKRGDPLNLEAQAARIYFSIFDRPGEPFSRSSNQGIVNSALNYGYAILRGAVARALVSSGLNCAFGIHHHNQYDAFCLADDMMEPYRPFVDLLVYLNLGLFEVSDDLTPELKKLLASCLTMDVVIGKMKRPLMNALSLTTASLARCFVEGGNELQCPSIPEIT